MSSAGARTAADAPLSVYAFACRADRYDRAGDLMRTVLRDRWLLALACVLFALAVPAIPVASASAPACDDPSIVQSVSLTHGEIEWTVDVICGSATHIDLQSTLYDNLGLPLASHTPTTGARVVCECDHATSTDHVTSGAGIYRVTGQAYFAGNVLDLQAFESRWLVLPGGFAVPVACTAGTETSRTGASRRLLETPLTPLPSITSLV
jgi:hypothetical protein